jgi:hypothetical protein
MGGITPQPGALARSLSGHGSRPRPEPASWFQRVLRNRNPASHMRPERLATRRTNWTRPASGQGPAIRSPCSPASFVSSRMTCSRQNRIITGGYRRLRRRYQHLLAGNAHGSPGLALLLLLQAPGTPAGNPCPAGTWRRCTGKAGVAVPARGRYQVGLVQGLLAGAERFRAQVRLHGHGLPQAARAEPLGTPRKKDLKTEPEDYPAFLRERPREGHGTLKAGNTTGGRPRPPEQGMGRASAGAVPP